MPRKDERSAFEETSDFADVGPFDDTGGQDDTRDGFEETEDGLEETSDGPEETKDGFEETEDGLEETSDGPEETKDGFEETEDGLEETSDGPEETKDGFEESGLECDRSDESEPPVQAAWGGQSLDETSEGAFDTAALHGWRRPPPLIEDDDDTSGFGARDNFETADAENMDFEFGLAVRDATPEAAPEAAPKVPHAARSKHPAADPGGTAAGLPGFGDSGTQQVPRDFLDELDALGDRGSCTDELSRADLPADTEAIALPAGLDARHDTSPIDGDDRDATSEGPLEWADPESSGEGEDPDATGWQKSADPGDTAAATAEISAGSTADATGEATAAELAAPSSVMRQVQSSLRSWTLPRGALWGALLGLQMAAVLLLVLVVGERSIRTPDAYFHMHVGEQILEAQAVPREANYTAFHQGPFIDVEWGFQAAVAWVGRRRGLKGLVLLRMGLFLVSTLLVFELCRRFGARGGPAVLGAAAFVVVASDRSLLAPESVSIALFALSLVLLEWRKLHWTIPLLLTPLTALWANVHGFFVLAPALMLVYGLTDLLRDRSPRTLLFLVPTSLASLVNPYGIEGALYPFRVVLDADKQALLRDLIVELRSPLFDSVLATTLPARKIQVLLVLAVIGTLLAVWRRGQRLRLTLLLLFAVALGASVLRNGGLFAVLAVPLALSGFAPWLERLGSSRAWWPIAGHASLAAAVLGGAVHLATGQGDLASIDGLDRGARFAPALDQDAAIGFYLDHGLPERVWCDFSSGHALIGRSAGAIRPALCPHTDLASLQLLRAYAEVTGGVQSLDTLLETYPADAFFVDHRRLLGSPLLDTLLFGERFALVYLDGRSAVFLARSGRTAALAAHLELDLAALVRDPEEGFRFLDEERARDQADVGWSGWIQRITGQTPPPVPRDRVSLSLLLLAAERPHAAHALATRAFELLPEWPATSYALGVSARAVGRFDEAKHHLRRVARATPNLAEPRHMLGLLHIELGELGRGIEALEAAARLEPNNARYAQNLRLAYRMAGRETEAAAVKILGAGQEARAARALERFHEAASLAGAKRDAEAENLYRAALALDPTLQVAYYNLGNLMFRRRRYSEALMNYRTALDLRPGDLEARYFLALTLDRLGRADEAKAELRAILAVQSNHKAARTLLGRIGGAAAGGAE